jgi:hypothetical protein
MTARSNRGKKELLHPVFLECRDYVDNQFWKSLFEEFAYGKYPKQLYITQQHTIQSTNRTNTFHYSFKGKSVPEMIPEIQDLLIKHTSLISSEEILVKKNDQLQYKQDTWASWKDIKKKYIKEILLMDYCTVIRNDYKLPMECIISLFQLLNYSNLQEVYMEDNKIVHIPGIVYDSDTRMFTIKNEYDEKLESLIEIPDHITNHCKRYLLRMVKKEE